MKFEGLPVSQNNRKEKELDEKPTLLSHLLEKESFVFDSCDEKKVDKYFDKQTFLLEKLKSLKEKINPKVFSSINLGLKIFLISKMIGGFDVQAQTINKEVEQNKNKIELTTENKANQIVADSTFIVEHDGVEGLEKDEDRKKIAHYLKELGIDNLNFHTEDSKLYGQYADIHREYRNFAEQNPSFLRFGASLYSGQFNLKDRTKNISEAINKMIPVKDSIQANKIAEEMYIEFCKKNDIDPAKQLCFNACYGGNLTSDKLGNIKFAFINIGEAIITGEYYTPAYVIAIHEINHLQRLSDGQHEGRLVGDIKTEALDEIVTKINEAINKDYIYKKINSISLEEEVEYPEKLNSDYNKGLSVGLVANTFRKLLKKYETIEECLMSQEGQDFVKEYYKNK